VPVIKILSPAVGASWCSAGFVIGGVVEPSGSGNLCAWLGELVPWP
jgi:hypothetical protein